MLRRRSSMPLLFMSFLLLTGVGDAAGQSPAAGPAPDPDVTARPKVLDVRQLRPGNNGVYTFGLNTVVVIDVEGLAAWEPAKRSPQRIIPYVGDIGIRGNGPLSIQLDRGDGVGRLTYHLQRLPGNDGNVQAWAQLLKNPNPFSPRRLVAVTVGTEEGDILPIKPGHAPVPKLEVFPPVGWAFIVFLVAAIVGFAVLVRRSDILRDLDGELPAPPPAGARLPYSLARTQLAAWFFAVLTAFVCLWLVTGDYRTFSASALGLLGISSGTAVTAALIDVSRRARRSALGLEISRLEQAVTELAAKVAASPPPADLAGLQAALVQRSVERDQKTAELNAIQNNCEPSRGFVRDILNASGGATAPGGTTFGGVSLQRFQVAVWTIILITVFLVGTYQTLAMPEFGGELLALMGISSGTYLLMKQPEGR